MSANSVNYFGYYKFIKEIFTAITLIKNLDFFDKIVLRNILIVLAENFQYF